MTIEPIGVLTYDNWNTKQFYTWKRWKLWFGDEIPSPSNPLRPPRSNKPAITRMEKVYSEPVVYEDRHQYMMYGVPTLLKYKEEPVWGKDEALKMIEAFFDNHLKLYPRHKLPRYIAISLDKRSHDGYGNRYYEELVEDWIWEPYYKWVKTVPMKPGEVVVNERTPESVMEDRNYRASVCELYLNPLGRKFVDLTDEKRKKKK